MPARFARHAPPTIGLALLATSAHAHEGHGIAGASHWHATDTWGLVVFGALALVAWWASRRGD